jgi:membrane protease subunit (stomatin/prohibitin family)
MPQPFVTQEHLRVRNALRIIGPIVFLVGFVGMPLMFVGGVCSGYGFMGAMARYAAREGVPVGVDAINYAAEGAQPGITTAARAIATGIRQGLSEPATTRTCARCHTANDVDAQFCKSCGTELTSS